jgi:signal transduction histidine kinase
MQDSKTRQEVELEQSEGGQFTEEELLARMNGLRHVSIFSDLPEPQLRWFAENCIERRLAPGDILVARGDKADWMMVILEGEAQFLRDENMRDGFVYIVRAGDPMTEVSGMLPYSRMTEFPSTARAVGHMRVLRFPTRLFPEMLERMPVLAQRLVGVMNDRVRESTRLDVQREKLMALGKLSAGLAHELNNPAAAARRAADELLEALNVLRAADLSLCRHDINLEQHNFITEFERQAIARQDDVQPLSALELSDREEAIASWLEDHDVEQAWSVASQLAEAGIDSESLTLVESHLDNEALGDVLSRVAAQLYTARLVKDIKAGTTRISELVGAIKEYTYMDQAPLQEIDLHRGIENTLLILKYKLKKKNITVIRDYAEDIPRIMAFGSALNQVWTNLIVNAIEAMSDGGTLKISTKREPFDVMVEVRDNGPGIAPNVQAHIFEPFFTTKPVGEGTGLGLDTSMRIVRKHHGNLRFETRPGDTCFQVRLPFEQPSDGQVKEPVTAGEA